MAKKESRGKWLTKGALKLVSYVCVDGAAAGITASVVPLTMINPIVGGIIVAGATIVSMAVCDRVVDNYVDDKVDECVDKYHENVDPIVDSIRLLAKAKEIFCEKGEQPTREFMKKNKFSDEQIEETIRQFKKKQ